jgi:predicted nucleic acid-binding protein
MKIYLDTCCYGRPQDDQTEPNTKAETEAVYGIIEILKDAEIAVFGSPALIDEISDTPDDDNNTREKIRAFYDDTVTEHLVSTANTILRAREFMALPMKEYDSYHLAYAEVAKIDYLVTTDKKFIKKAARLCNTVVVINPKDFLPEVIKWLQ